MPRGRLRSGGGFQRPSPRRKSAWEEGPGSTAVTSFSTVTPAFVGSGLAVLLDGATLVRCRGHLRVIIRSVAALGDNLTGAFGIGIVKLPAFTAGIASVPTPIAEQDFESWIYWTAVSVGSMATTAQFGSAGWAFFDAVVDSKAMRKVESDDVIYAAMEFGTEVGTVTADVFFDSRLLFLLA